MSAATPNPDGPLNISESDLKGSCYRLNRVLDLLYEMIKSSGKSTTTTASTTVITAPAAESPLGGPWREPVGTINGTNVEFTITPAVAGGCNLILVLNGVIQGASDVTLAVNTITYATAPRAGDWHRYMWARSG